MLSLLKIMFLFTEIFKMKGLFLVAVLSVLVLQAGECHTSDYVIDAEF